MAETLVELVARIKADATLLEKGLTDAEKQTEASSKKMQDSLKKVGTVMAASGAAITAALGLMGKAAIDEEINIKRLATTINNSGTAYDSVKDSLEAVIAATQRKTGVADNEQRDILNRLILVTNDYGKALELLPTVLDLAAAGEMDATTAATYLGKAFLELEDGAEEVSVRFGQASLKFKDMEDIQNRVAGSAENLANPLNVLKASIGDVAEAIGSNLIPLIKGAVDKIVDITIKIQDWIKEHPELASQLTYLALILGGVFTAIGALILILPDLIASYKALTVVIDLATASTWGFYASLVAIPAAIGLAVIALSELTGNTERMNRMGQTLWYQNIGNWIMRQLGLAEAIETTSGFTSTLNSELYNLGLRGEELTQTFETLAEAGYLSIGTSTIERVQQLVEKIESLKEKSDDAADALKNLDFATQSMKQAIGHATWQADGYTYSMSLFSQAEIDAAKASGKKVEKLKTQSDVTKDNIDKTNKYVDSLNAAKTASDNLSDSLAASPMMSEEERIARQNYISEVIQRGVTWIPPFPDFASGGVVPGIIGQPQLAMVHGGETIIPANESMGDVIVNFFQPVFFDREDTMNRFVDMIRKGIQRQDRLRYGGAYSG